MHYGKELKTGQLWQIISMQIFIEKSLILDEAFKFELNDRLDSSPVGWLKIHES